MAKDPAFLFYPGDWLAGTLGMTFEQKGAYMELLMMQFNRGHMTTDMIGHVLGQSFGQIWDVLRHKFTQDKDGLWYNKRLEIEKKARQSYVKSRKTNLLGINQYTSKNGHTRGHMVGHMTSHMENENNINNNSIISKVSIDSISKEPEPEKMTLVEKSLAYYQQQINENALDTENIDSYREFVRYLFGDNPIHEPPMHILKLKTQMSFYDFLKVSSLANKNGVVLIDKLDNLVNNKKYTRDRISFPAILESWIRRTHV